MSKISAAALSFLVVFSAALFGASAQELNSYSIEVDIDKQNIADVKLVLVFSEPVSEFGIFLPVRITNFNATSTAGPVFCDNLIGTASLISCKMNLTSDKKTFEMEFQSADLVKQIENRYVFSGDFGIRTPVKEVFAAVRIPEGMVLSQNIPGGSTLPPTDSTSTDGRKITVIWRFNDVIQTDLINFQVFYEPGIDISQNFGGPPWRYVALAAVVVAAVFAFIFLRRRKKTQQVVLSVLDDYEKRVISSIEKEGGTINQKKIVIDTNLSKAKVSRVVQKLSERGLLEVERRGRTNIVKFLKKKLE